MFVEAQVVDAETWLRKYLPTELKLFLDNFGHRCLKEFELMSDPWGTVLSPVVATLQAMLSPRQTSHHNSQVSKNKHSKLV